MLCCIMAGVPGTQLNNVANLQLDKSAIAQGKVQIYTKNECLLGHYSLNVSFSSPARMNFCPHTELAIIPLFPNAHAQIIWSRLRGRQIRMRSVCLYCLYNN